MRRSNCQSISGGGAKYYPSRHSNTVDSNPTQVTCLSDPRMIVLHARKVLRDTGPYNSNDRVYETTVPLGTPNVSCRGML